MEIKRRTQVERSETTRRALVSAARTLFAERGYHEVGTTEIASVAGVTRGALYHQFADKTALFAAVLEEAETELTAHVAEVLAGADRSDPLAALALGATTWLDACARPEFAQIVLIDGPGVLGWEGWREVGMRHGVGLTSVALGQAMEAGLIPTQPLQPLVHILIGAVDEAALYIARAEDPDRARQEINAVIGRLVRSLATA